MCKQEESKLAGGILADEMGLGKSNYSSTSSHGTQYNLTPASISCTDDLNHDT